MHFRKNLPKNPAKDIAVLPIVRPNTPRCVFNCCIDGKNWFPLPFVAMSRLVKKPQKISISQKYMRFCQLIHCWLLLWYHQKMRRRWGRRSCVVWMLWNEDWNIEGCIVMLEISSIWLENSLLDVFYLI